MTEEQKTPIVKFIVNKGEIGNIHTSLKILIDERLTGCPRTDVLLMDIMAKLAPVYDELAYKDTVALELDPESAHICWLALRYVMENALAPKSQQTKLISLIQHMGFALQKLDDLRVENDSTK